MVYNPDKCFDVIECGQNALNYLMLINQGQVLWTYPVLITSVNSECDVEIHGKKLKNTMNLIDYFEQLAMGEEDE